ncbi:transcription cofactor [Lithospermum erythrorhizon]|uniref:Nuclear nucleic acid-binding protein C1D n=1 Tax=Lithospermum erythrorhizon TaxID=34254 RepID=A0AAV3RB94_LITER
MADKSKSSNKKNGDGIIPESVLDAVNKTATNMVELKSHFDEFIPLCSDPQVLSKLEPLERAKAFLLLAKATTTVFAVRLRCKGMDIDEHPVKSEIERLNLYQEKLQRAIDLSKAPLRPSVTINSRAATRFIEHSLPDLRVEQKRSMRDISRGKSPHNKYKENSIHKKKKFQTTDKQSVKSAAQEFLEKAAKEL